MKTYSTGMCSRLMFASSIVVKPDILIVDEILGVGDAYFAHKSFERMRELCARRRRRRCCWSPTTSIRR